MSCFKTCCFVGCYSLYQEAGDYSAQPESVAKHQHCHDETPGDSLPEAGHHEYGHCSLDTRRNRGGSVWSGEKSMTGRERGEEGNRVKEEERINV